MKHHRPGWRSSSGVSLQGGTVMVFECMLSMICALTPFAAKDLSPPPPDLPEIAPWRIVALDADYGGQWVVAGDLTGDGQPEIVSAENFNERDTHYTSAVAAQRLDGTVLWRWGNPDKGRKHWHHDVACQIHDWDGNGRADVIVCDEGALVELDGRTGREKRRIPIAQDATDCLVFCDLSGTGRPTDVLVKNRYEQIWAYNQAAQLLWTVSYPGVYRTAHQPVPLDIDGDGRDEILAGNALLNHDGSERWVYSTEAVDLTRGHLDCARVLERGERAEDWRIVMTFCGANLLVATDGHGKALWEVTGHHFESINIGVLRPDLPGKQIAVDIDHRPHGDSPIWFLDGDGRQLGELITPYSRHHKLLDWTGDGVCELVVAHNRALYDAQGNRLATFHMEDERLAAAQGVELSVLLGDMDGDGITDVLIVTPTHVHIYRNPSARAATPGPVGTGMNVTLY